jgi:hypothetical protein
MQEQKNTVEVFRTNVATEEHATILLDILTEIFPACCISFDLEDCDKVLRISGTDICTETVTKLMTNQGFTCSPLE